MDRSTTYAAAAGAVTIVLSWMLAQFASINIPAEVGQAVTLLVMTAFVHFTSDAAHPPK